MRRAIRSFIGENCKYEIFMAPISLPNNWKAKNIAYYTLWPPSQQTEISKYERGQVNIWIKGSSQRILQKLMLGLLSADTLSFGNLTSQLYIGVPFPDFLMKSPKKAEMQASVFQSNFCLDKEFSCSNYPGVPLNNCSLHISLSYWAYPTFFFF